MQTDNPISRTKQHAKLLTFMGRQVLVFLTRNSDDKLQLLVQLWSTTADAQVRALVNLETDAQAMVAFDSFTDVTVEDFIVAAGIDAVL